MSGLRIAKVMKVHPEANAVDLVFLDNAGRAPMIQVLGAFGALDLPEPTPPAREGDTAPTGGVDIYAVTGNVGGIPIVLGFLKPQVAQVLFKGRPNFRVNRHGSGVYSTLEDDGALTMAWPNGTYLKVGEDPDREDLTGADFDGKWANENRNAGKKTHMRLVVRDGGETKVQIQITPQGYLQMVLDKDLVLAIAGGITGKVNNVDLEVPAGVTVKGDVTAKSLSSESGASGVFSTPGGGVVTVNSGIVTSIT